METIDTLYNRCSYHLSLSLIFLSISFIMSVIEGKVQVPKTKDKGKDMIIVK